jgi:hypothetical protein
VSNREARAYEIAIVNASIRRGAMDSVAFVTAAVVLTAAVSAAQDPLLAARDLYRAAAYEDALVRLDTLKGSTHVAEEGLAIEQYRAFCLLALGRTAEAERAIEAVVTAAPSFRPSEAEQSPRVRAAFRDVRRRALPGIIQQQYAQAKAAFDRHDAKAATTGFQQVLDLLADPDLASVVDQPPLASLRPLAVGFRDLSASAIPAPAAAPAAAAAPSSRLEPPAQPPPKRVYGAEDMSVVPPVVVRESWAALAGVFAVRTGVVEIVIDETGAVAAATMTVAVNAVYDRLALATAVKWRYRPATLNGVPVKFRKVILLDLKATRNN